MVYPILSGSLALVPVTAAHGVTPGGLILVAIFYFGTGIADVDLGHFLPMGSTVSCLGETPIWV